ncbi:MAG TPA: hypothetical protein VGP88_04820, partial [Thermoplasmata archaeon]|nr:hypothetical protein [Thermoplasmata archaeon]
LGVDPSGEPQELPDTVVLATILASIEAERTGLSQRLHIGSSESLEAVASVFWPLVVVPSPVPGRVAIFDGTGVWRRSFRYSLLPPLEPIHASLERPATPTELLQTLEGLRPRFSEDPGAEVLAVEGFLPVDPPLLFDVLAQAEFRREPQSPHPGFLPARHDYAWYVAAVDQMGRWMDRFGADLQHLDTLKAKVADRLGNALVEADAETELLRADGERRLDRARHDLARESDRLHGMVLNDTRRESEVVRVSHAAVARGIIEQRTADLLAARSVERGADAAPHLARGRRAAAEVRDAHRAIRESLERLEAVHERERAAVMALMGRVTAVEHDQAEQLAGRELFRDQLAGVGHEVVSAVDGHLAARAQQRDLLQQYFLAPLSAPSVRVIWFPLWIALLRGPHGLRGSVFPPMRLRSGGDLGSALKGLFGGTVLPLEPRTAHFNGALRRTFEDALATDPWLAHAAFEIVRGADVLLDPDLPMRLSAGLHELVEAGWIGAKGSRRLEAVYDGIVRERMAATGGPAEAAAVEVTAPAPARRPPSAIA